MSLDAATARLAHILRAENAALAEGDATAATALLPEKLAAVDALRAALPGAPDPATAATLRDLAAENTRRLTQALEVQARILELVVRAARHTTPATSYRPQNARAPLTAAQALLTRA